MRNYQTSSFGGMLGFEDVVVVDYLTLDREVAIAVVAEGRADYYFEEWKKEEDKWAVPSLLVGDGRCLAAFGVGEGTVGKEDFAFREALAGGVVDLGGAS
jgi:hypothetical protein